MVEHYYSKEQSSALNLKKIKIVVKGASFELYSGSGIFSKGSLDAGTKVLLEHMLMQDSWKALDLGCGYGVVGIYLRKNFNAHVVMADINSRAVMIAKKNAQLYGFKDIEVIESDLFQSIKGTFDTILANPPQNAGKETCFKLIEQSKEHLLKGGLLQLVARHNKGGKFLMLKMQETFGNVKAIAKKAGYWVYLSRKE